MEIKSRSVAGIFAAARELPPAEQSAFLEKECSGDSELRLEVESLLAAYDRAGESSGGEQDSQLDTAHAVPLREESGQQIGQYHLLVKVGEGCFADVWLAEQKEPVHRWVALKIIKLGMDTTEVVARFGAERQTLALMDHPNIAKVFDSGVTETGRPYFVMELVRGAPITAYCDTHRLRIEDRLKLFVQVCHAVQHAHGKGIIHRDLKPSNILVATLNGIAVPKVIDFGIAKATAQRLTDRTVSRRFRQFIGTPAYMSPEQTEVNWEDIDTRSDIYSLGVLLYELLTGVTPLENEALAKAALEEIRRMIRQAGFPAPSMRLVQMSDQAAEVASLRQTDARDLRRSLSGGLDGIVMRALEKDRAQRYDTALTFARDIERCLCSQPVGTVGSL